MNSLMAKKKKVLYSAAASLLTFTGLANRVCTERNHAGEHARTHPYLWKSPSGGWHPFSAAKPPGKSEQTNKKKRDMTSVVRGWCQGEEPRAPEQRLMELSSFTLNRPHVHTNMQENCWSCGSSAADWMKLISQHTYTHTHTHTHTGRQGWIID